MRSPVYRNLDRPFEILGFTIFELMVLCIALVGGGELAQFLSFQRIWSVLLTMVLALIFFWLRRSLGDLFLRRFFRFLFLPSELSPKLYDFEMDKKHAI